MDDLILQEDCGKQWEMLLVLLSTEEKKVNRTQDGEIATMQYYLNHNSLSQILVEWISRIRYANGVKVIESDTPIKCDLVALYWKDVGNQHYRSREFCAAYRCYTKSVLYAIQTGTIYPLALANRSAVLIKLHRYQESVIDATRALDYGYPEETRHKVLMRRADCYFEMNDPGKAMEAMAEAQYHITQFVVPQSSIADYERLYRNLDMKLRQENQPVQPPPPSTSLPDNFRIKNDEFVAASPKLALTQSDEKGRHVLTKEPVRRGDILFSEEPYAWVAIAAEVYVCEMCCAAEINPIACLTCSRTTYCSESCREQAQRFHRWECSAAQIGILPAIGVGHLALRVLLTHMDHGFPLAPADVPVPETAAALFAAYSHVENIDLYSSETPAFYRMHNLVANFEKMTSGEHTQYAVTAMLVFLYLERYTDLLETLRTRMAHELPLNELRLFTLAVLFRTVGQLVCNGHVTFALTTAQLGSYAVKLPEKETNRASAIYLSASMMNHSCDPNIVNTFYKKRLIVRSSRDLATGAEVFNCYGPHKAREVTGSRRVRLETQYKFTCDCEPCRNPESFVQLFTSAYACHACRGPVVWTGERVRCGSCNEEFVFERVASQLDHADDLATQASNCTQLWEQCNLMQQAMRIKQQVYHRHHIYVRRDALRLGRLYSTIGDHARSIEMMKHAIQGAECQFGSFSVETAQALRELATVLLDRVKSLDEHPPEYRDWCLEAQKVARKAHQLMELNYGPWERLVQQCAEVERVATNLVLGQPIAPNVGANMYNLRI